MKHIAKVSWKKQPEEIFTDGKYSRAHRWIFDGGIEVEASSSPEVIPIPMSTETAVDPEEAFIAALSSCHMLFFLSVAASKKYIISDYKDFAEGTMSKDEGGRMVMKAVVLNPDITFFGLNTPSPEQIAEMHQLSHGKCYLANSVKSEVKINY